MKYHALISKYLQCLINSTFIGIDNKVLEKNVYLKISVEAGIDSSYAFDPLATVRLRCVSFPKYSFRQVQQLNLDCAEVFL